ncbi:hypothetical protein LSTR_LSTR014025 [Laodelphax striatellus]|uniref:Uncharacterized protein n=1 Tax=Laodelphax striatellus TaxID=195883 RepID=A0A482WIQ6_LAOST|nr:hypothetical protein LSTR_LSTR014025 [Laodelphax striatellus]
MSFIAFETASSTWLLIFVRISSARLLLSRVTDDGLLPEIEALACLQGVDELPFLLPIVSSVIKQA